MPRVNFSVMARPAAEALREPTTATIGFRSNSGSAAHGDQRRRRVDGPQERWIIRLAERDEPRCRPCRPLPFAQGAVARRQHDGTALGLADQFRQGGERCSAPPCRLSSVGTCAARSFSQRISCSQSSFSARSVKPRTPNSSPSGRSGLRSRRAGGRCFRECFDPQDHGHGHGGAGLDAAAHGQQTKATRRSRPGRRRGIAGNRPCQPDDGEGQPRGPGDAERQPRKVATPLPPLKPSQTGKTWPRKAQKPAIAQAVDPNARKSARRPSPFSASSSSVAAAMSLRPVRSTLVAPILPEPMARMSRDPPPASAASRTGWTRADSRQARRPAPEARNS